MDAGTFFDTNSFAKLPAAQRLEQQRQEVYWLRLMDALQKKHEAEAAGLLQYNTFRVRSWQPDLEIALARIIHYRQKQSLNPPGISTVSDTSTADRHQLFTQLESLAAQERTTGKAAVPADLDALLRGPNACAAARSAAAAGAFHKTDPRCPPVNAPTFRAAEKQGLLYPVFESQETSR